MYTETVKVSLEFKNKKQKYIKHRENNNNKTYNNTYTDTQLSTELFLNGVENLNIDSFWRMSN